MPKKLNIAVIGFRGFPDIEGGVENHCKNLYEILDTFDKVNLYIFRRKGYVNENTVKYKNISFIDLEHPSNASLEAFFHTLVSIFYIISKLRFVQIVHVHNIGPGIFLPLIKLFGFKTILTYHSDNYNHSKWNFFQRIVLKTGEFLSTLLADKIIFVSPVFQEKTRFKKKSIYIPNGVKIDLNANCINPKITSIVKYLLYVGRITPEKGIDLLIDAFNNLMIPNLKLIIIGSSSSNEYMNSLKSRSNDNVIYLGSLRHEELAYYYKNAQLFILPSYSEGLPIVALEALYFRIPILLSDIENNMVFNLPKDFYFKSGDSSDLLRSIIRILKNPPEFPDYIDDMLKEFNWHNIAERTFTIYQELV